MQDRAAKVAHLIRVLKIAFIVAGILFIVIMIRIPSQAGAPPSTVVERAIVVMALACAVLGFLAPRFLGQAIRAQNRSNPDPLQKQLTLSILSLAFFNAAVLFGFVLHFLGAGTLFVRIAVAAGMISMLVWKPRALPNAEDGDTQGLR